MFEVENKTIRVLRDKLENCDYRYSSDPDLLPLFFTDEQIQKIRESLPKLPDAKIARFASEYRISLYDANVLSGEKGLADYFAMGLIQIVDDKIIKEVAQKVIQENMEQVKK